MLNWMLKPSELFGMITREQALECLRRGIGNPAADFREGQWEA